MTLLSTNSIGGALQFDLGVSLEMSGENLLGLGVETKLEQKRERTYQSMKISPFRQVSVGTSKSKSQEELHLLFCDSDNTAVEKLRTLANIPLDFFCCQPCVLNQESKSASQKYKSLMVCLLVPTVNGYLRDLDVLPETLTDMAKRRVSEEGVISDNFIRMYGDCFVSSVEYCQVFLAALTFECSSTAGKDIREANIEKSTSGNAVLPMLIDVSKVLMTHQASLSVVETFSKPSLLLSSKSSPSLFSSKKATVRETLGALIDSSEIFIKQAKSEKDMDVGAIKSVQVTPWSQIGLKQKKRSSYCSCCSEGCSCSSGCDSCLSGCSSFFSACFSCFSGCFSRLSRGCSSCLDSCCVM